MQRRRRRTVTSKPKTEVINIRDPRYPKFQPGMKEFIGRPSKWGNPFIIGRHGTREEVVEQYEEYIRRKPELLNDLHELVGKVLVCYCKPEACHGDVLLKIMKERGL